MNNFTSQFKTLFLMGFLTILLVLFGRALGGTSGMILALGISLVMNGISYWHSDKLAIKMTRSVPINRAENPYLYDIVENLAHKARIPMPKLYLTPSMQPNAFATGRNPEHASVAVTEGLLRLLNKEELEGVIAHELAHIKNRDILIGTITAVMAGVITMLADWAQWALLFGSNNDEEGGVSGLAALPLIILGPIAALIVQMAVSRSREYLADATGAEIAGNSRGLASALQRLHEYSHVPMPVNPATSHMFIMNPFSGKALLSLFSTHPPIEDRIRKLLK